MFKYNKFYIDDICFREINIKNNNDYIRGLFFTDTHFSPSTPVGRLDNLTETSLIKFREVFEIGNDRQVDFYGHGGDVFDNPTVSDLLTGEILNILKNNKKPIFVIAGGHDLFNNNLNKIYRTKLGLLAKGGFVELLKHPDKNRYLLNNGIVNLEISGTSSHVDIDICSIEKDYVVQKLYGDRLVHLIHGMLTPKGSNPFNTIFIEDILETEADLTFSGHKHDGFETVTIDGRTFANTGSIVRVDADFGEMSRKPKVLIVDFYKDRIEIVEEVYLKSAKEGTEVLDRTHIEKANDKKKRKEVFLQELEGEGNIEAIKIEDIIEHISELKKIPRNAVKIALDKIGEIQESMPEKDLKLSVNPMITEVILKNFRTYKDQRFKISNGITVLKGESDKGKSNLLKAIRWVEYGEPQGDGVIFYGEDECSATIVVRNSIRVTKTRKLTKSKATIKWLIEYEDGTEEKFSGDKTPKEVLEILGVTKIVLDKDKSLTLNYAGQHDPPFLLTETGTVKAKAIGSIVKGNILDMAERVTIKEIAQTSSTVEALEEELTAITSDLKRFDYIDETEKQITRMESKINALKELNDEIEYLKEINTKYKAKCKEEDDLKAIISSLNIVDEMSKKYEELNKVYKDYNFAKKNKEKLQGYEVEIKSLNEIISESKKADILEDKYNKLKDIKKDYDFLVSSNEKLSKKKKEEKECLEIIEGLKNAEIMERKLEELSTIYKETNKLKELNTKYKELKEKETLGIKFLEKNKSNTEIRVNDYIRALKKQGKCPVCLNNLDSTHIEEIKSELLGV